MTHNTNHDNAMSSAAYWTKRDAAMETEIQSETEYRNTRAGRINTLLRNLSSYDSGRVRWDAQLSAQVDAWQAELDALQAEIKAETEAKTEAEWTREATIARRAEWNALIKSGKLSKNGKPWPPYMREQEKRQGWTMDDLKAAVTRHDLTGK